MVYMMMGLKYCNMLKKIAYDHSFIAVIYWLAVYKLLKLNNFSVFQFPKVGYSCFK